MKKHLLAIAVASAVAVPAMAQVSISGRIDTSIGRYEDSAGKSTTKIDSNLLTTNEIVITGTEDLGGGLKAGFRFVSPFASDKNGAFDFGGRGAILSLEGGFGKIDLGRSTGNMGNSIMASSVVGNRGNLDTAEARPNNSVSYSTPNMGGFVVRVLHGLGGETDPNTGEQTEISLSYSAGPLLVRLARADYDGVAGSNSPITGDETHAQLDYDFGVAKLNTRYRKQSSDVNATLSTKRYGVGVSVPLGSGLSAAADYMDHDNNTASNTDQTRITLALVKTLSKRTNVYAALQMDNYDSAALKDADTLAVGVRHNF